MTARSGTPTAEGVRRGTLRHVPVLLPEVLGALAPQANETFIDGTFGAGGYTAALLRTAHGRARAGDRSRSRCRCCGTEPRCTKPGAADAGRRHASAISIRSLRRQGFAPADGVVLDIGVSSMQLDEAERGFSFQSDGPLDMRMGGERADRCRRRQHGEDDAKLADILFHLGEERRSRAMARAIVAPPQRKTVHAYIGARRAGGDGAGPCQDRRPARRHAHVPGAAHLRQRRAGRADARAHRGRARTEAGRAAGGRHLPFAGGWHRQALPQAARRGRTPGLAPPAARRISASWRRASGSTSPRPISPRREQEIDRQPPGAFGQAAIGNPYGSAALAGGSVGPGHSPPCELAPRPCHV